MSTAETLGSCLAALGAVAAVIRFFMKYETRLAFAERDSLQALQLSTVLDKEQVATSQRVDSIDTTLRAIGDSLSRLQLIDSMAADIRSMKERMDEKYKEIVPRSEVDHRLAGIEDRIENAITIFKEDKTGR